MTVETKVMVAPHSKESEMMVLGCMLTSINSMNIASETLTSSDFYFIEHQLIFTILKNAYKKDKSADVHLVCEELKRLGKLDVVGGAAYVTTLAQYAGTSAYVEEYCQILRNKSYSRQALATFQEAEKNFLSGLIDSKQMDQRLQSYLGILSHANQYKLAQGVKNAYWIREK